MGTPDLESPSLGPASIGTLAGPLPPLFFVEATGTPSSVDCGGSPASSRGGRLPEVQDNGIGERSTNAQKRHERRAKPGTNRNMFVLPWQIQ